MKKLFLMLLAFMGFTAASAQTETKTTTKKETKTVETKEKIKQGDTLKSAHERKRKESTDESAIRRDSTAGSPSSTKSTEATTRKKTDNGNLAVPEKPTK